MLTTMQHTVRFLVVTAILSASSLLAIEPPAVPAAPTPAQILSAHKVFISNGESTGIIWPLSLPYDAFYSGMKTWGKYELVTSPADADIIFEVRYLNRDYPLTTERVQILVLDPKTHVTLWQFIEEIKGWTRDDTGRNNFQLTINTLIDEVKKLAAGTNGQRQVR
jgi:hypothetical protein